MFIGIFLVYPYTSESVIPMKHFYTLLSLLILSVAAQAQLISKFTWDTYADPARADYGPNATGISTYATIETGGSNGTKGLSPGASGAHDINMYLPASYYEIPSLEIYIDFKRKESDAVFFTLGTFSFGMSGGSLYAKFLVKRNGVDSTVALNGLYSLPSDNAFHTYHYSYAASTGIATVSADGTNVGSWQAPTTGSKTILSWTGAGASATVGQIMDGTGANMPIIDNLIINNTDGYVTLPLRLTSFDAVKAGSTNQLSWTTTHEDDVQGFTIERSPDGISYDAIGTVSAEQRGYEAANAYTFTDNAPVATNYYRLKMTDIDGTAAYSSVKKITNAVAASISVYPNPVVNTVNIRLGEEEGTWAYAVTTIDGKTLKAGSIAGSQASLDLENAPKGLLIIRLKNAENEAQTFKLLKQ